MAAQHHGELDQQHLRVAHDVADAAGKITYKYFRTPFTIDDKQDASPVTIADREAETKMRELITAAFPDHGVFGEEHGLKRGTGEGARWMWVLDPIDGTKSFITGKPLFGTLVSLLHDGVPVLGIIDQPVLRERWTGVRGQPTTLNGRPIRTRSCSRIGDALLYATTPHMFSGPSEAAFNRVRDQVRIPLYGCDCYAYGLLAAGFVDLVVEADLKPYDYMALVPIVEGAGGKITDWRGQSLRWDVGEEGSDTLRSLPGEVLAAGDVSIHQAALDALSWEADAQLTTR